MHASVDRKKNLRTRFCDWLRKVSSDAQNNIIILHLLTIRFGYQDYTIFEEFLLRFINFSMPTTNKNALNR